MKKIIGSLVLFVIGLNVALAEYTMEHEDYCEVLVTGSDLCDKKHQQIYEKMAKQPINFNKEYVLIYINDYDYKHYIAINPKTKMIYPTVLSTKSNNHNSVELFFNRNSNEFCRTDRKMKENSRPDTKDHYTIFEPYIPMRSGDVIGYEMACEKLEKNDFEVLEFKRVYK